MWIVCEGVLDHPRLYTCLFNGFGVIWSWGAKHRVSHGASARALAESDLSLCLITSFCSQTTVNSTKWGSPDPWAISWDPSTRTPRGRGSIQQVSEMQYLRGVLCYYKLDPPSSFSSLWQPCSCCHPDVSHQQLSAVTASPQPEKKILQAAQIVLSRESC